MGEFTFHLEQFFESTGANGKNGQKQHCRQWIALRIKREQQFRLLKRRPPTTTAGRQRSIPKQCFKLRLHTFSPEKNSTLVILLFKSRKCFRFADFGTIPFPEFRIKSAFLLEYTPNRESVPKSRLKFPFPLQNRKYAQNAPHETPFQL